jgi:hypothetical protein
VEDFSVRAKAKSCDISVITPALAPRGDKVLRGGPSILLTDHRKMRRGTLHGDKGMGRACQLCLGISDINLFSYGQGIIHFDAQISDRAFDLGMPEQS